MKYEKRVLVGIALVVALALLIVPKVWSVSVPISVNLNKAFGKTCDIVIVKRIAFSGEVSSDTYNNVDSLDLVFGLGLDTLWSIVLLVQPNAGDSVVSWPFLNNFRSSSGAYDWRLMPYYGDLTADSTILEFKVNSTLQTRTSAADKYRGAVSSFDTIISIAPYNHYEAKFNIYETGENQPIEWIWTTFSDTAGGDGGGGTSVGSLTYAVVSGSVYWPDGQPVVGAVIEARRVSSTNATVTTSTGVKALIAPLITIATTGTSGAFSLNLLRSNQFVNTGDKKYNIRGTYDGAEIFKIDGLIIPSTGNLNIADSIAARP